MSPIQIKDSVQEVLNSLPDNVILVAAAKTRTAEEVEQAIQAGVNILGYNYVQEAEQVYRQIGTRVKWHMIGHLQRNKVKKIVPFVDMIESVDSIALAGTIDSCCAPLDKVMAILIEVNSGRESSKNGLLPDDVETVVRQISEFRHVQIQGLMTMGSFGGNPEDSRAYFRVTKQLFNHLAKCRITNVDMRYLSMGMSDTYQVAIEEGANMVRIGTRLFGPRTI